MENSKEKNMSRGKSVFAQRKENTKGVLYFLIILTVAHFFWKFFVVGDEDGDQVIFFGLDISQPFIFMAHHIAEFTHKILNFVGYETTLSPNNIIRHNESHHAVRIIWGCTGIKQAYIFFCIIAFNKGPWKHKPWYILMGLAFVYLFNIFRIALITAIIDKHPDQFDFWHGQVLKYAFYFMIFILWVIWEEKFHLGKKESR